MSPALLVVLVVFLLLIFIGLGYFYIKSNTPATTVSTTSTTTTPNESVPSTTIIAYNDVDCEVGKWSNWGECGSDGFRKRTRDVIKEQEGNGQFCPVLEEKEDCKSLLLFKRPGDVVGVLRGKGKYSEEFPKDTVITFPSDSNLIVLTWNNAYNDGKPIIYFKRYDHNNTNLSFRTYSDIKSYKIIDVSEQMKQFGSNADRLPNETDDDWATRIARYITGDNNTNLNEYQLSQVAAILKGRDKVSVDKDMQGSICARLVEWGWWSLKNDSQDSVLNNINNNGYCFYALNAPQ